MGRSRLPLELIPKEKSRKITFQKRTMGLKKKTYEISTLCGVDACVIIYSRSSDDRSTEPIFWPSNPDEVKSIINRYKEHCKEERSLKTQDLSGFFEERTKKIQKKLSKLGHHGGDNSKFPTFDDRLNDLSADQLRDLMKKCREKLELVQSRVEFLKMNQAIFEGPAMVNPNFRTTAMSASQGLHVPYLTAIDSSIPLLPNPMMTPLMNPKMGRMMTMTTNDGAGSSQFGGGPSGCNTQYAPPLQHPFYYDPTSGMLENIVYNNHGASSSGSCYYAPPSIVPPMLPYIPNQMMPPNASQMNRNYDGNDLNINDNKHGIRYGGL